MGKAFDNLISSYEKFKSEQKHIKESLLKCYCPKCRCEAHIPESELAKKTEFKAYCFNCNISFKVYKKDFS